MPSEPLKAAFTMAADAYRRSIAALVPLLQEIALESVRDVLPEADHLEVRVHLEDEFTTRLRIERVLSIDGVALFVAGAGHPDEAVERQIDEVNIEYLDVLIDLAPETHAGLSTIPPGR